MKNFQFIEYHWLISQDISCFCVFEVLFRKLYTTSITLRVFHIVSFHCFSIYLFVYFLVYLFMMVYYYVDQESLEFTKIPVPTSNVMVLNMNATTSRFVSNFKLGCFVHLNQKCSYRKQKRKPHKMVKIRVKKIQQFSFLHNTILCTVEYIQSTVILSCNKQLNISIYVCVCLYLCALRHTQTVVSVKKFRKIFHLLQLQQNECLRIHKEKNITTMKISKPHEIR